jgi:hypothetical protein
MNFLVDREGNISVLRVSILITLIGGIFVGGSVLTFVLDQQTRSAPLFVDLPPGAEQWGSPIIHADTWQEVFYRVPNGNLEALARHYDSKMRGFYGAEQNTEVCIRFPTTGYYTNNRGDPNGTFQENFVPGQNLPVYWSCMFDRSGLNSTQWTQVTLYDGLSNPDPNRSSLGSVVIVYEQRWNR